MEGFSGGAIYGASQKFRFIGNMARVVFPEHNPSPRLKRRNEFFAPPKIHLFPFSIKAVLKLLGKLLSNFVGPFNRFNFAPLVSPCRAFRRCVLFVCIIGRVGELYLDGCDTTLLLLT